MKEFLPLEKLTRDQKRRFIILTDMENEPDDSQTMVKLLLYSNEIDIEGLVAVTSCWLQDEVYPESIVSRIQAYGIVLPNLKKHASGWPTPESLLAITGGGQAGFGMAAVGDGKTTEGSKIIVDALLKNDPRPVYFSINAGANTLAQAMWDMRKKLDTETLKLCLSKIRVLDDSGQDDAGAWINQEFPEVFYIRNSPQVYGLNGPDLNMGPQPWKPLNQYTWAEVNVRRRHGILGELFPQRIIYPGNHASCFPRDVVGLFFWFMDGGGTTGVLTMLNNGLNDPEEISWGGWGGRFLWEKRKIFAGESVNSPKEGGSGSNASIDEGPYVWENMYPCANDTWTDEDSGITYEHNIFVPLWRFRKDILLDFQARMDWCVDDFAHANHHPIARINGDDGERCILKGTISAGQTVQLDASASSDPDGNALSFKWWIYHEAGSYPGIVKLGADTEAQLTLSVPEDAAAGNTIHMICEVADNNPIVSLKAYRRIVLTVV